VPRDSAIIHGHKNIALNTDHIEINKYSGLDDASYKAVLVEIKDMVVEGPKRVQARSKRNTPCSHPNTCRLTNYLLARVIPQDNRRKSQDLYLCTLK